MNPNQLNSQDQVNNQDFVDKQPVVSQQLVPKKPKKKLLLILGGAFIGVLMFGGLVGAVLYRNEKNKPENVLAESVKNLLITKDDQRFETTSKIKLANETMGIKEVELKLDIQNSGMNAQTNFEVNLSVLRLRGAVQIRDNGDIYVKVKDLPALLSSDFASGAGIPEEMKAKLSELDDKWVEIKKEDIAELSGSDEYSKTYDKCMKSLYGLREDKSFGKMVGNAYKDNRFMKINNSSDEVVDGVKLLKIEVGLDQNAAKIFGKNVGDLEQIKSVAKSCNDASATTPETEVENVNDFENGKLTVWIDRGKRKIKMIEASGETNLDEQEAVGLESINLNVKVVDPKEKIEKPTDSINIKDLMAQFGVDESTLNSSQLDSDVESVLN